MELLTKHKRFFIFLFLSIFLVSFVYAQQPPSVQTNININTGLEIEVTQLGILGNGKNHLFNTHVFNISTQLLVDDTTTQCDFHLFDDEGIHIINREPMTYDSSSLSFEFNVTSDNFIRNGAYSYLIICNATAIGGFVSVGIEVTETGSILKEGEGIVLFGIILILILVTIFFLVATIFIENPPFKVFLGSLAVLILIGTLGFGVTIMQQLFGTFTNIVSSYTLFFRLFMVLLGGAGISLVFFLVVFAMRLFNESKGRID